MNFIWEVEYLVIKLIEDTKITFKIENKRGSVNCVLDLTI